MSQLDLDALGGRWRAVNRRAEARIEVDLAAVRSLLMARTTRAFGRHSRWLLVEIIAMAVVVAALCGFIAGHLGNWPLLLCATPLLMLAFADLVVAGLQWRALSRLDLQAPILQVRATLHGLRARRLRMARWIFLTSVLLWLPLIIVVVRAAFGVDLLRVLPPNVVLINALVGVLFIPLAMWIAGLVADRFKGKPAYQRFLDDVAGRSWAQANSALAATLELDQQLADDAGEALRQQTDLRAISEAVAVPVRALRMRLAVSIAVHAVLILATAMFNVTHGGLPHFIVPGVLLHFVLIAQMATAIEHLVTLSRLQRGAQRLEWIGSLQRVLRLRERVLRWTIASTPLTLLLLLQVGARVVAGVDLLADFGVGVAAALVGAASLICASLLLRWLPRSSRAAAIIDALSFGALTRTRQLVDRLQ